jgi:hypothetical protein
MHRVLFIAYDFPPGIVIAGGLRSANFVHYLPDFSWQPTVVALDNRQEKLPDIIRIPSLTPWHSPYEVTPYGWAYALHRYLRNCSDKFDLVYVSCPPYPHALAAAAFAHRTQLWIIYATLGIRSCLAAGIGILGRLGAFNARSYLKLLGLTAK